MSQTSLPAALSRRSTKSLSATRIREFVIKSGLIGCTIFSILITVSIVLLLVWQSQKFFEYDEVSVAGFFGGIKWNPTLGNVKNFGIWPLICGTLWVTFIAMCVAIPMGLITAIFLSEYAPRLSLIHI